MDAHQSLMARWQGGAGLRLESLTPGLAPPLPLPGEPERWSLLQRLRRSQADPTPWIDALEAGEEAPEPDLLAVLARLVEPAGARRLLALAGAAVLAALERELGVWDDTARSAWLEPLLDLARSGSALAGDPVLLPLLGRCRDPRVAARLRQALEPGADIGVSLGQNLLPLLGHQRQPGDLPLLLRHALDPGPISLRRAALEGVALGLGAWPQAPLREALTTLALDLDPVLAARAVDLLARLPQGATVLHRLSRRALDPGLHQRLERRLQASLRPLVLVVHGRSGGAIPAELLALASDLAERRRTPVQLVALSGGEQEPSAEVEAALRARGGVRLVPLLLLPGGHVRHDLPGIANRWRGFGPLARSPFLGAWPGWQHLLASMVAEAAGQGRSLLWLHHPVSGHLPGRYLAHLARCSGAAALPTSYTADDPGAHLPRGAELVWQPLALAANRLTDSLRDQPDGPPLRPPLLQQGAVRRFLLEQLAALP
jgi:sirohydrochlorin ferrochelatase